MFIGMCITLENRREKGPNMFMSFNSCLKLYWILLCLCSPMAVFTQSVSPFSYGLREATSPVETYRVLLKTHQEALKNHCQVDYSGIHELYIEIPEDGVSIPLGGSVDFKGIKLYVSNKAKDMYLFSLQQTLMPLNLSKEEFVSGKYLNHIEFRDGLTMLVIQDENLWVNNRKGYNYGATRKDVILVKQRKAQNIPVSSYNTEKSKPIFYYCKTSGNEKLIENLNFIRTADCSFKTYCVRIENQNHVTVRNIKIKTPDSNLYGDVAITVNNSTNTKLENINIEGTYSQLKTFGYGVFLNNVWNTQIIGMKASAQWGVFGNNNVNCVQLKDCKINRFDIHCYGRDVYMENCRLFDLYNQYSSVYGIVYHKNCIFDQTIPCLIEASYNAYTPFDLVFDRCTFKMSSQKNTIVSLYGLSDEKNSRPELIKKCLPNVYMKRCKLVPLNSMKTWHIFQLRWNCKLSEKLSYCSILEIEHLDIYGNNIEFSPFNVNVSTENKLDCRFKHWKVICDSLNY